MVCGTNIDPPSERLRPLPHLKLSQPVFAAVAALHRDNLEVVLVYDERGECAVGVFTPRDLVAVVALGLDPRELTLGQWLAASEQGESRDRKGECWFG